MFLLFCFFQRYDGDVGDLGLTLSYDEDVMGQVRIDMDELINYSVVIKYSLKEVLCVLTACLPWVDTWRENNASHKRKQVKHISRKN